MWTRLFTAALVVSLGLAAATSVQAQPNLEALEKKIRQEVAPAGVPLGAPPAAAPTAAEPAKREPGYAGVVVDDRQDRGRGVRIVKVTPGGPADKAGLRPQDLITGLGGVRVRQLTDAALILEQVPPGGSLEIEFLRGDQSQKVTLVFGRRPAPSPAAGNPSTADKPVPEPPQPEPPAAAPAKGSADPQARIEALERRVEQLEQRIRVLERALGFPEAKK